MKRNKKIKILTIIVLVVAVIGMSIGFAVFSNVLTISSSATVIPSEEDFKVTIYGCVDQNEMYADNFDLTKWSTTQMYSFHNDGEHLTISTSNPAIIDNSSLSIKNVNGNFTEPDSIFYVFLIKNEGLYNAYVSLDEEFVQKFNSNTFTGTCAAGEGATLSLVEAACMEVVAFPAEIVDLNGNDIYEQVLNGTYIIEPDNSIMVVFLVGYGFTSDPVRADGPFSVNFDPIKFRFSTVLNSN